jgi:hypothetical protein
MNSISNIWKHPRTSVAGVLISVATVAGVLAKQGVTLGTLGGGSVVTLASALATALLGLLARDPGTPAAQPAASCTGDCSNSSGNGGTSGTTAKLSAWMLIALLLPLPWMQGCNASSVAQDIVNWTPSLQSAIEAVDSTAALLAPADAPVFTAATSGFDAASNLLVGQAQAYLANPSADTLGKLQTQIVLLQQQVNSALLSAAHIVDSASQQHALAAIQAVATIVTAILALVQSVSSKAQVAQMAAQSTIKLAVVGPYLDGRGSARMVAAHYDEPVSVARMQVEQAEQEEVEAGF